MNRRRCSLAVSGLLSLAIAPAQAADWTVTDPGDAGDGTCDASCTLRDAVAVAGADDRILFDPSLPSPLVLALGGAPLPISVPLRIIANDGVPTRVQRSGGSGRLLELLPGADVRIVGLEFRDGLAQAASLAEGGAIRVAAGARLELRQCVFRDNSAIVSGGSAGADGGTARGGAVHSDGELLVDGCAFVANVARGNGGAAGAPGGGNGGGGGNALGGAIHASGSLEVLNSTFHLNEALGGDGGNGSAFAANSGTPGGNGGDGGEAHGGAIWASASAAPTIAFSTLIANRVQSGAGGLGAGPVMGVPQNPGGQPGLAGAESAAALGSDADLVLDTSAIAVNVGDTVCDGAGQIAQRSGNLSDENTCPGTLTPALLGAFVPIDVDAPLPHFRPLEDAAPVDATPDCLDALGAEAVVLDQILNPRPVAPPGATPACDYGAVEFNPLLFRDGFEALAPEP